MTLENNMLSIGTIVNTFGIKGYLKLILNSNLELNGNIKDIKVIFYKNSNNSFIPLKIEDISFKDTNLLIKFIDFNNINDVMKFKNQNLYIQKDLDIFIEKLNYLQFIIKFNDNTGIVIDEMNNGKQDLIKVKFKNSNEAFWVPVVDVYIKKIDEENKLIFLQNVEGLI